MWDDIGYNKNQRSGVTAQQILRKADDTREKGMMGKDSSYYLKESKAEEMYSHSKRILRNRNGDEFRKRPEGCVSNFSDPLTRDEVMLSGKLSKMEYRRKSNEDFEELEAMRNGAINKSLEKGLLHRRKKREKDTSGETNQVRSQFSLDPRKRIPEKYAYQTDKRNLSSHSDKTTKPTQLQNQTSRKQLDSLSSFDFQQTMGRLPDRTRVPETNTRVRPKSAGQAMYMRVNCLSSDSDDSSLDGEIEVIDLEDSLQFDDDASAKPVSASLYDDKSRESSTNSDVFILRADDDMAQFRSYPGNGESRRQHDKRRNFEAHGQTGFSVPKKIDDNDVTDLSVKRSRKLMTSETRGRIKSEPDIVRPLDSLKFKHSKSQSVRVKSESGNNTSYQILEHQENKPKMNHSKGSVETDLGSLKPRFNKEKLYADAFEKVLSKYSKFTIARDGTTQPAPMSVPDKRITSRAARAHLPRKLKPIPKREKLGPISQNKAGERDFEIPSH